MKLFHHLHLLQEDLVGPNNRRLFVAWCLTVAIVLGLGIYLSNDSVSVLGVADSHEFQVSFDSAVTIKQIHVLPGQLIKRGDLILELNQNELEMQLYTLKARSDKLAAEIKLRQQISKLAQDAGTLSPEADPLKTEWDDTQREIGLVKDRLKHLYVFAEMPGRVGAVNYKAGEKVPAFASIVTLLPVTPGFITGFVNENLQSSLAIGDRVEVASITGSTTPGKIISLGARIVPIPQRLLRVQTLPAWGREVVVQIPEKNPFLIGEKVSVHRAWTSSFVSLAKAEEPSGLSAKIEKDPEPVDIPFSISETYKPELSGMVYIPELSQFVLISDDYPHHKPVLFLMSPDGKLQDHTLPIEGLDKMEDIESVSYQDGYLYLLSSMSLTKKGKDKNYRHLFARVQRQGMDFRLDAQIDFRKVLMDAFATSSDADLKSVPEDIDDFEVEGHALRGEDMYLALKNPMGPHNEIYILKIAGFKSIFTNGTLDSKNITMARKLPLNLPDQDIQVKVTDMIFIDDQIYLASSFHGKQGSGIWRMDPATGAVSLVHEFKRKHLEALGVLPAHCEILGIFEGKAGNFVTTVPLADDKKGSRCF